MQIIAEIGKNFLDKDGVNADLVIDLIKKAKDSGATVAKFQTHVFKDEKLKRSPDRYDWIKFNEQNTPLSFWDSVKKICDNNDIEFMTTPMSKLAAIKVNDFVSRWKVSSADITDFDLLGYLKETKKPIILSTGMSTDWQIKKAVDFLGDQIEYINYCVSLYPCPIYKINLIKILELMNSYNLPVGFSDHSLSVEVPVLAVRMQVCAIEKHFTLDRSAFGPDHKVSLLPDEFKTMVGLCRLAEEQGESFEEEQKYWKNFRIKN